MANPEQQARKGLKVFMEMLAQANLQHEFAPDPAGYMHRHEVDFDSLPPQLQQLLSSLRDDNAGVALLGRFQDKLDGAQLLERQNPNTPERFATVCKF